MAKHRNFIIANIFAFYLLPFVIFDTNSAVLILMVLIPLILILVSFMDCWHNGFKWYLPLITMALFFPTVFLYYNETALFYVFFYGFIAMMPMAIARFTKGIINAKKKA